MTEQYELNYLVMPKFVYKDDRLTDIARRVYCFIHTYKSPQFFFSNDHMAEMFDCSSQRISDAIKLLHELEYIKTERKTKAGGGEIRFIIDAYGESKMTSRASQKGLAGNEPTASQKHLGNDTKDNNLKVGKNSSAPYKVDPEVRKERKSKKGPGPGMKNYAQNFTPYPKKVRTIANGRNIA